MQFLRSPDGGKLQHNSIAPIIPTQKLLKLINEDARKHFIPMIDTIFKSSTNFSSEWDCYTIYTVCRFIKKMCKNAAGMWHLLGFLMCVSFTWHEQTPNFSIGDTRLEIWLHFVKIIRDLLLELILSYLMFTLKWVKTQSLPEITDTTYFTD